MHRIIVALFLGVGVGLVSIGFGWDFITMVGICIVASVFMNILSDIYEKNP